MLLALDARTIYRPPRRGTGKNLLDLYRHLAAARPDWRVLAMHRNPAAEQGLLPAETVEPRFMEMVGDRFEAWERWRLPMAAWRAGANVLHCPANSSPAWQPTPTLVTIHDLIPLDLPQGRTADEVERFEQSVRHACHRAAAIICPSFYTRRRLIGEMGADPGRVMVNPWAADSSVQLMEARDWQPVALCYGVDRPTVLHFGAADPRKNTAGVLEAWARLDPSIRGAWSLLVVGLDGAILNSLRGFVAARGIQESVLLHGFAPEEDVSALLNSAEVLAFPSLSEGFGLPILDAWATHTAVLTSNRTSLPEVAGDAALLVDPVDPDAIADALGRLMENETLRAGLIDFGTRRLRGYTWAHTAERFARVVEFAAGGGSLEQSAA